MHDGTVVPAAHEPSEPGEPDGTGEPGEPDGTGEPDEAAPSASPRRGRGLVIGVAVAVLAAGVGAAAALGAFGGDPVAAPTPEVVVLPSPTPTVAPVARTPMSPFADALPASVLGYALAAVAEERPLLVAGALEGYRLGYTDGADGAVTVLAGQWATPEEAAAAVAAMTAGAPPLDDGEPASGEVVVGGAPAGTWVATRTADGAGAVTWTNGSAALQVIAPADVVREVYAAYPF